MKKIFTLLSVVIVALQLMTANAENTAPVAYEATDVTNHTMTAYWSACPGAISYILRTYPIQLEGLVFRDKFANCTPNDVYEVGPAGDLSMNGYADHNGWWGDGIEGTNGGVIINNGGVLSLYGNETDLKIYPYVKKRTIKFKAKAYDIDSICTIRLACGGSSEMTIDLTPEEKWYTMVVEREYPNYFGMLYMGCMFQNMTYEPGNNRVVLTDFKVYWGDYSEPQPQSQPQNDAPNAKYISLDWSGDTTFVYNIPADSTCFKFGKYINELGNEQMDAYHYIDNFTYWHYDVKAIYANGQESEWSNQIAYTVSPWPEFLEDEADDDEPISVPGDVNGDGMVTSADITALYNFILLNDDSQIVHGDQDGDGDITTHDVTFVYELLL